MSEWKIVPGREIPEIENAKKEILVSGDVLMLAAIRVGEYCWATVFVPSAIALDLDPTNSPMTDIISAAQKANLKLETPGSSITADLLVSCHEIVKLRNTYTHRQINKKQAAASLKEAYGNLPGFNNLSIVKRKSNSNDTNNPIGGNEFW